MKRLITPRVDLPRRSLLIAAAMLAWAMSAQAGELLLGTPRSVETLVSVPVLLRTDADAGVAGLDFTFSHDPEVFELVGVTAGSASRDARKELTTRAEQPGEVRVVLTGVNREILANGTVVTVELRRKTGQSGESLLEITDTTFTSLDARELPSQGDTATLRWENGEKRPDPAPATPPGELPAGDADDGTTPVPAWEAALVDSAEAGKQPGEPDLPAAAETQKIDSALDRASALRGSLEDPGEAPARPGGSLQADATDLPDIAPVPVPGPGAHRVDPTDDGVTTGVIRSSAVAEKRQEDQAETPVQASPQSSRKRITLAAMALAAGALLFALCYRLRGWLRP